MGTTKAQRRKAAKKKAREKRIRKEANIRRNQGEDKYRLDVFVDGQWIRGVMSFRSIERVDSYVETTESRRRMGEEIAHGKVAEVETGKVVREIPPSKPKGALPDAITDGPRADPNVTGQAIPVPANLVVETEPKDVLTGKPDSE